MGYGGYGGYPQQGYGGGGYGGYQPPAAYGGYGGYPQQGYGGYQQQPAMQPMPSLRIWSMSKKSGGAAFGFSGLGGHGRRPPLAPAQVESQQCEPPPQVLALHIFLKFFGHLARPPRAPFVQQSHPFV